MKPFTKSLAGATLAAFAIATAGPAVARDLTVTAWGGSSQAAQERVYYEPFTEETGIPIVQDSWSGGIGALRTKVQGGNANWDVVQVEAEELILGCQEGLLEELDWDMLGGRDQFIEGAAHDCGVGSVVWTTGLVYDGDVLEDGPTSWADFWDLEQYPGQRMLRRGPKYTLEFALMADGVPAEEVYDVLSTPEGVDRAFAKLDEIKPNIIWWTAGSQAPQLLASGEVTMGAAYFSRILSANKTEDRNFEVVWNQSIPAIDYWVILAGSPNREQAMQLIQYMTAAEKQKDFPPESFQGITNVDASAQIDPAVAPKLPTHDENMAVALPLDSEFWVDNIDELTQRFNAWAAQ